ncbi:[FeFe] hydrogenase H-cluster radical SAM maturase HydE [Desulfovibrio inopinatus]|uniref:[FeFe] hydrogenase H-cluster radical SAM maturase HydE n=1 Tax=Desulfovibrio inopinatus TaxID=102109 RepID=UPI00040FF05B|nr:[FeFe] hydrogenase H-cluster radical SAM maturase HydE [Desulfovibrio inopinatus]
MQRNEIIDVLHAPDATALFASARALCDSIFGRKVYQRGVVEFSTICQKNCHYCGLRHANTQIRRFMLEKDTILTAVRHVVGMKIGTVVLQSGENHAMDIRLVGDVITHIKKIADVAVTLSLGDHATETYAYWRDCGADRYLLKIETFDETLHARLRPNQTVAKRFRRLEALHRLGYETGSGIISGLPGMTTTVLANDLLRLSELPLSMIAIGPFVPHHDTPLGAYVAGNTDEALRAIALLRIMNPLANIPATSALDALLPKGRERGLDAGANVVMPSVTPEPVRADYTIYPGKNSSSLSVQRTVATLQHRLRIAGYIPSSTRGFSPTRLHAAYADLTSEKEHRHV